MPARITRPPCTRYQSECRLTVSRMASRITWAATSSGMVMVRLLHQSESAQSPMDAASMAPTRRGEYRVSRGNVDVAKHDSKALLSPLRPRHAAAIDRERWTIVRCRSSEELLDAGHRSSPRRHRG